MLTSVRCPFCGGENSVVGARRCDHYLLRSADDCACAAPLSEPLRHRIHALCVARGASVVPSDPWITQRLFLRGDVVIVHERSARGVRGHYFLEDPARRERMANLLVEEWTHKDHPLAKKETEA